MPPEFRGPFPLNVETVDAEITKISPGNYRLGLKNVGGEFVPYYVGRSDKNLNQRLKDWVGEYDWFTTAYAPSTKDAHEQECRDYHNLNPRDNKEHPKRPAETNLKCPICGAEC